MSEKSPGTPAASLIPLSSRQVSPLRWRDCGQAAHWLKSELAAEPARLGLLSPGDEVRCIPDPEEPQAEGFSLLLESGDRRFFVDVVLESLRSDHLLGLFERCTNAGLNSPGPPIMPVLVIEKVGLPYLGLVALIARDRSLLVIQMDLLQVGDAFLIHFTRVLEKREVLERLDRAERASQHDRILTELMPGGPTEFARLSGRPLASAVSNSLWEEVSAWLSSDEGSLRTGES